MAGSVYLSVYSSVCLWPAICLLAEKVYQLPLAETRFTNPQLYDYFYYYSQIYMSPDRYARSHA